jgi:hypothetical protein
MVAGAGRAQARAVTAGIVRFIQLLDRGTTVLIKLVCILEIALRMILL